VGAIMKKLPMLTKSFVGFSVFLAIPLIIAGFVFNYNLVRYSENEISKTSVINLKIAKSLNDQLVDSITKQTIRLSMDIALYDIGGINDYYKIKNNADDMVKLSRVYQIIVDTANVNYRVHSIYVYIEDTNYFITSNHGVVVKDEFSDTGWIKEYNASKNKTIGTLWLKSRPIGSGNDPNGNVITFIMPLNNFMVNSEGAIVVNLYEREIYKFLNDPSFENQGFISIINNEGVVISHADKSLIGKNISEKPFIREILQTNDTTGYFVDDASGNRQLISFYKSEFNNWIYMGTTPLNSLINKTSNLRNGMIFLIIILMAIGIVFSYLFSKIVYNPVKKLMSDLQNRKGIDFKGGGNEMTILSRVFDSLAKQEDTLSNALEKNKQTLKNKYLTDLLKGDIEDANQDKQEEADFPYKYFICVLIAIDRYDVFCEKYPHDQQYYMKLMILKACDEVSNASFKITGVLYEKNKIAVIINSENYDPESTYEDLQMAFITLQNEAAKVMSNSLTIGIGKCYDNMNNISLSFFEAQQAIKNRMLKGSGSIILYEDSSDEDSKYYYPYHIEKHILNFLKLGLKQELIAAIEELIEEIKNRKGISSDNIIQIFIQLIGNTVKFLVDMNINISHVFGNDYNIYQRLSSKETLDEISVWLMGFYSGMLQYMANMGDDNKSQADRILDYLYNNYKLNIDTTSIADSIGLSYSSVGRIVKNKTGKNVLEYINGLRIEEAKRLLRQTNMNMMDIAINIGYNNDQSFARFFKKYEGVTPGEFRNIH
jgi:YesN/AraC family two-component response regulator